MKAEIIKWLVDNSIQNYSLIQEELNENLVYFIDVEGDVILENYHISDISNIPEFINFRYVNGKIQLASKNNTSSIPSNIDEEDTESSDSTEELENVLDHPNKTDPEEGIMLNQEKMKEIEDFMHSVSKDLSLRSERDKYKDEAINRMSKQIEAFERGFTDQIKEQILKDLIILYDSIDRASGLASSEDKEIANEIELLKDELEEILFTHGLEEIEEIVGTEYNRDLHKVKSKEYTEIPEENQLVQEIVRKGFTRNHKIIRKQEIIIKVYKTDTEPDN